MNRRHPSRPVIPRSVTIIRWGVFILAGINVWQAGAIDRQALLLLNWSPAVDPRWRAILTAAWALWFAALGIALWQKRPWTRGAIPASIAGYTLYHLSLLALASSPVARSGWPLTALAGTLATAFAYWAVARPAVHSYFQR